MVGGRQQFARVSDFPSSATETKTELFRGHFNQRESPEAKEALQLEMEAKEEARMNKAKAELERMDAEKSK